MTTDGTGAVGQQVQQQDPPPGETDPAGTDPESPRDSNVPDDDQDARDDADQDADDQGSRRSREAHYRRRAQAAEAERDQARAQLDALQRSVVDSIVVNAGYSPKLLAGAERSEFVNDDGSVDADKVLKATTEAAAELGVTRRPRPPEANFQQGARGVPAAGSGVARLIAEALGR